MRALAKEQISWHVSRIWNGDRTFERILKDQHNASHLCPTCIQEKVFERTLSVVVNPVTKEKDRYVGMSEYNKVSWNICSCPLVAVTHRVTVERLVREVRIILKTSESRIKKKMRRFPLRGNS